jgi:predicted dehydrogenase
MAAKQRRKIRYAVAGPGHIAQVAVLPAFAHARSNSELVAVISNDPKKARFLARKYPIEGFAGYDDFEACIRDLEIDAVYVALPNHLHREFTVRAAQAGAHVLCEKPMAVDVADCLAMIDACEAAGVKLMIAYRLHFQAAHLGALEIARTRRLGDLMTGHGNLTICVKDKDNIRLNPRRLGGGPLYDLGIYCINAARCAFESEPVRVFAFESRSGPLFEQTEETLCGVLEFPRGRLFTFQCSMGAAPTSDLRIVGTKGDLVLESGFDYAEGMKQRLTIGERTTVKRFPKQDQFAPELVYFSDCILRNRLPEPSGLEGLLDVRVINALHESATLGVAVALEPVRRAGGPSLDQKITKPPIRKPETMHATSPSGD